LNSSDLIAATNEALETGKATRGLQLLREHNQRFTGDASAWHRQAVLEEQIGDWDQAGLAHYQCISIAPNNHIGYLYLGTWLKHDNQIEAAAAAFSLAQDIDPSSLQLWRSSGVSEATRQRSKLADNVSRRFLTKHHLASISTSKIHSCIKDSIWVRTHAAPVTVNDPLYAPELFLIPDLERKPVHLSSSFSWVPDLLDQFDFIKQEMHSVLKDNTAQLLRPYLPQTLAVHNSLRTLAGSHNWSALDLYKDGVLNESVANRFPRTLAALEKIPTYGLHDTPYEAFFSILKPGQTIAPHFGQSNHSLNVHLPMSVPEQCHLSVANKQYQWQEGEPLIFDDSYWHSAHNNSNQSRIVLIFSVWHPALSIDDQRLVQNCFKARQRWLDNRLQLLKLALPQS